MRIYSMFYCPFAQRTRIVLNAKKVKHDTVNVHLQAKPDWLFKMNPIGKVPVLEIDGKFLIESMVTCDYLEEAYPDPSLYPSDVFEKAVQKGLIELFADKVIFPYHRALYRIRKNEGWGDLLEEVKSGLVLFEEELARRRTKFFFGDRPGMLDYCIFPWFERFPVAEATFPGMVAFPKDKFPLLTAYSAYMHEDKAAQATIANFTDQVNFMKSFVSGVVDYDIGCQSDSQL
ncbi:UNVERIFIED_CONTAM: hypothetical protein GTU68_057877 [Idotea baltica]|nr:hypothetical protein [Idotea baltica]